MSGFWLNIYKEQGITSFGVVSKIRKILNIKKVGHGGTLDPFATGVLPIAVGEATKTVDYVMTNRKKYAFTLTFGEERDTGDIDGEATETSEKIPTEDEILSILPEFVGEIEQTPPKYSAIKIDGRRAYDLARGGKEFEIKSRVVSIYDLKFLGFEEVDGADMGSSQDSTNSQRVNDSGNLKNAKFVVECGKGTYIRSLSQDIARKVGALGYTSKLERLMVGNFKKENALTLEELENHEKNGDLEEYVTNIKESLGEMREVKISNVDEKKIRNGVIIFYDDINISPSGEGLETSKDEIVKVINEGNSVTALAKLDGNKIKAFKIFH